MNIDEVSHIGYQIDFYRSEPTVFVTSISYVDVYGWEPDNKPTSLDLVSKWIQWSPREDYILMPREEWAIAPGSAEWTAVALNPTLSWKTGICSVDYHNPSIKPPSASVKWIDDLTAVGTAYGDDACQHWVGKFDGSLGETLPIKKSETRTGGYSLMSVKGRNLIIYQIDNCETEIDNFQPFCLSYNLDSNNDVQVDCPKTLYRRKE